MTVHVVPSEDPASKLLQTTVKIGDSDLLMEVDTGASVTVISEATLDQPVGTQPALPLQTTGVRSPMYTEDEIPVVGRLTVKVQYQG